MRGVPAFKNALLNCEENYDRLALMCTVDDPVLMQALFGDSDFEARVLQDENLQNLVLSVSRVNSPHQASSVTSLVSCMNKILELTKDNETITITRLDQIAKLNNPDGAIITELLKVLNKNISGYEGFLDSIAKERSRREIEARSLAGISAGVRARVEVTGLEEKVTTPVGEYTSPQRNHEVDLRVG